MAENKANWGGISRTSLPCQGSKQARAGTKRINHGENRANREGNTRENSFSTIFSVVSVFSVLKVFAFLLNRFDTFPGAVVEKRNASQVAARDVPK